MQFDIAVIGGGPSGTAAAITAARSGRRVVLVERSQFPRYRPGETLHPGIEPLLRQLGVWDEIEQQGFVRHAGVTIQSAEQVRSTQYGSDENGPWLGLQAWRADFDQLLMQKSRELGVHILQPCVVGKILVRDRCVVGVETDQGTIFADFIVDAAGNRHWLSHQLGIPLQTESPRLLARFGYVEGVYAAAHATPVLKVDTSGWTWIARVRENLYQWTRLSLMDDQVNATASDAAELPVELRALRAVGHINGADVTWRCVSAPAGTGYFLCGDAAAVLDPAASHGVLKAVMSGIYVGHLVGQIAEHAKTRNEAVKEYSDWIKSSFHHDVNSLREHYSRMGMIMPAVNTIAT